MQKKVSSEYTNSEIILVQTFSDFMKNVTDDSLNIISASNFDDFDTSGFVYKVHDFFCFKSNHKFHIFHYMEKDKSGLSCGLLSSENVIIHMVFRDYKGTIQARIDAEL
jgi:hypothetical protein